MKGDFDHYQPCYFLVVGHVDFCNVSVQAEVVVESIKKPDQVMARGSFRPTVAMS